VLSLAALVSCGKKSRDGASDEPPTGFSDMASPITPACEEANAKRSSVGCEYFAVHMEGIATADSGCFVAFVANTQKEASVHVGVTFGGEAVDVGSFARIPHGTGRKLKYDTFDPAAGIPPGEVAILFLAGLPEPGKPAANPDISKPSPCPVAPARSTLTQIHGTGRGLAFHITTDVPVVAYQMLPYGGGAAAVTGATLLLPTSVWGTNYLAVNAYGSGTLVGNRATSMNIVAKEDDTQVTILPVADIAPGPDISPAKANEPMTYTLAAGEHLQLTQPDELTGSPIESTKPVAVFAGMPCMNVPNGAPYCDHAEQQIPPISAMGHEYAAVSYRQRTQTPENPPWRFIGAVDGTKLTFDPPFTGAPPKLNRGDVVEVRNGDPFVVRSQDADHPFLVLSYMTGATEVGQGQHDGVGDADFVRSVPIAQYMNRYVFFTDPTYPETNLVVVRKSQKDVVLDCAGTLGGWQPLGGGLEFTRIDLSRHDFQGQNGCDNGIHEMHSDDPFGLWVWGWGSDETVSFTGYVSYGYPAGENVANLTNVVVPANPR
jgi:hypothetical protein